jgi:hypothetical protein
MKEEDLLTQAEKTPVRTGPVLFDLCFGHGTNEGIFLTTA